MLRRASVRRESLVKNSAVISASKVQHEALATVVRCYLSLFSLRFLSNFFSSIWETRLLPS